MKSVWDFQPQERIVRNDWKGSGKALEILEMIWEMEKTKGRQKPGSRKELRMGGKKSWEVQRILRGSVRWREL
jgi:hypothetical protein